MSGSLLWRLAEAAERWNLFEVTLIVVSAGTIVMAIVGIIASIWFVSSALGWGCG